MTLKEWAHEKAEYLKKHPTTSNVINVANEIRHLTINDHPLSEAQVNLAVKYLEDELGTLSIVKESYDNQATLTMIQQIKAVLAQNGNKS